MTADEQLLLSVLAALGPTTAGRVAAYTGETLDETLESLKNLSDGLVTVHAEKSGSYEGGDPVIVRVRPDLPSIRKRLGILSTRSGADNDSGPRLNARVDPRLTFAERTLAGAVSRMEDADRLATAQKVENYLLQCIALLQPSVGPWSRLRSVADIHQLIDGNLRDAPKVARILLDLDLVRILMAATERGPVELQDLSRAASTVAFLAERMEPAALRQLLNGFIGVALAMTNSVFRTMSAERLIATLAWRNIQREAASSATAAARALQLVIEQLLSRDRDRDDWGPSGLLRLIAHMPDGTVHVSVYSDLLSFLPSHRVERRSSALAGVVVDVTTDAGAYPELERCAEGLVDDLRRSPFASDAAMLGQVAQFFQQWTPIEDSAGGEVEEPVTEARRRLLEYVGAPGT